MMKRLTDNWHWSGGLLVALLMLAVAICGGCQSSDPYQAGYSREAYAAGLNALTAARADGSIDDNFSIDVEAARELTVLVLDLRDPEHAVVVSVPFASEGSPAVRASPALRSIEYVRKIIALAYQAESVAHGVTAKAKAIGLPLSAEDWQAIKLKQEAAEREWIEKLPRGTL